MNASILLLALLLLVAVLVGAYVLWPLLRRPTQGEAAADAAAMSRSVLRERRRELETALAHLPADSPERRAAMAEFAAQADDELAASPAAPTAAPAAVARRPGTAAALAAVMIVPTFGLYLLSGAPEAVSPEFAAAPREPASLDELVVDLRTRLAREPKDLDAWRLLGRAELARGRADEARDAFERAMALAPGDAQVRVDYADALAQAQGAVLEGRPIALIREALAIDARNPKALALAGAYEVGRNDFPAAIVLWKRLLEVLPADSEQARQVAGFLADLQAGRPPQVAARPAAPAAGAGGPGPNAQAAGAGGSGPNAQAAGGSAAAAPPSADAAASKAAALSGRIDVERRIADRLEPGATVFVAARTLDAEGRPAGPPVAVLRARGSDLPLAFTLDDGLAMSPMARLSTVPPGAQVVVIARVSRSGEATARPGDLQGASQPVKPGATGLRVLIDAVVE
ncbi:MAG: c-type cytochrome biogenesis protein CcmI [Burkholderiales bacterium]